MQNKGSSLFKQTPHQAQLQNEQLAAHIEEQQDNQKITGDLFKQQKQPASSVNSSAMKNSIFAGGNIVGKQTVDQNMENEDILNQNGQDAPGMAPNGLVLTTCFKLAINGDSRLTTGCDMLTDFFRGGFVPKKLYEIYGESGSGKTQFAIQLLLQSLLPVNCGGLEGQSLYLMTGKPLNEKRFNEIKEYFLVQNKNKISEQQIRENIIFSHCQTLEDYNKVFINLAQRIENERIKVVIIDNIQSVGDNFIKADGQVDFIERSNFLLKHSKNLKKIAYQYNLIILILNNVTSDVNGNAGDPSRGFFQEKRNAVQPSLGLLWSNCVNERICLKKRSHGGGGSGFGDNVKRTMMIDKSAYLRRNEINFEVHPGGVRGKHE